MALIARSSIIFLNMLIDTHAHLNFNAFRNDADEVIRRSLDNNAWMINVGSQYTTSRRAVDIAERYEKGVYAAVGLHPTHLETRLVKIKTDPEEIEFTTREEEFDYEKYKDLARRPRVVAIGEVGLDYYWKPKNRTKFSELQEKQKATLIRQLELAKEMNLPVILHCRMAHQDLLAILKLQALGSHFRGVIHCFTGTLEQAEQYLAAGFYLGFNGIIFKRANGLPDYDKIIKNVPEDRILLETDCPYLTPPQVSGRNEPLYVSHIAQKIAEIRNTDYDNVLSHTAENARAFFSL